MNYSLACIFWEIAGLLFLLVGLYDYFNRKEEPVGFFSSLSAPEVDNIKLYNQATGKLWMIYFVGYEALGLFLLTGKETLIVMITIFGFIIWSLILVGTYMVLVLKRYEKKTIKEETVHE